MKGYNMNRHDRRKQQATDKSSVSEIEKTIITVSRIGADAKTKVVIDVMALLDPTGGLGPVIPGIVLSDIADHLARAIHRTVPERDELDIRNDILKAMCDEDRFKSEDPARSDMVGGLVN
jgi:hypothetical protein